MCVGAGAHPTWHPRGPAGSAPLRRDAGLAFGTRNEEIHGPCPSARPPADDLVRRGGAPIEPIPPTREPSAHAAADDSPGAAVAITSASILAAQTCAGRSTETH